MSESAPHLIVETGRHVSAQEAKRNRADAAGRARPRADPRS